MCTFNRSINKLLLSMNQLVDEKCYLEHVYFPGHGVQCADTEFRDCPRPTLEEVKVRDSSQEEGPSVEERRGERLHFTKILP